MMLTGHLLLILCISFTIVSAKDIVKKPTNTGTTSAPATEPPPPPPPKSCADDGKCKEKNKKCNAELKCICDLEFREISDGSCVEKPKVGESCFDNITWVECGGQGVNPNCYSGEGPKHGKCVCYNGFEPNGKDCQQIKKKLGDKCGDDSECVAAYSACDKGKCVCSTGFTADGGLCKPNEYKCSSGEPKKENGAAVKCVVDFNEANGTIVDSCGKGYSCFVPPHTLTDVGKPRGHCCPTSSADKAQLVCPYGEPLANATCPDKKATSSGSKKESTCPSESHQCFSIESRPHEMICCQSPCRQAVTIFDHDGLCYTYSVLGSACELTAQCTGDAECAEDGGRKVCRCKKGYTQTSANICEEAE